MHHGPAALFRLLGDDARLRILRLLDAERLNVTELTAILGIAQSGVSRHLGLLKDAGLVDERRDEGRDAGDHPEPPGARRRGEERHQTVAAPHGRDPTSARGGRSAKASRGEQTHLGDPFVVPIHVDDAETVMERRLGDEKVGDRRSVPEAVVVGQIPLQRERAVEDVGWGGRLRKGFAKLGGEHVVLDRRPRRVKLLELADRADPEPTG